MSGRMSDGFWLFCVITYAVLPAMIDSALGLAPIPRRHHDAHPHVAVAIDRRAEFEASQRALPQVSIGLGLFVLVAMGKLGYDWYAAVREPSPRRERRTAAPKKSPAVSEDRLSADLRRALSVPGSALPGEPR